MGTVNIVNPTGALPNHPLPAPTSNPAEATPSTDGAASSGGKTPAVAPDTAARARVATMLEALPKPSTTEKVTRFVCDWGGVVNVLTDSCTDTERMAARRGDSASLESAQLSSGINLATLGIPLLGGIVGKVAKKGAREVTEEAAEAAAKAAVKTGAGFAKGALAGVRDLSTTLAKKLADDDYMKVGADYLYRHGENTVRAIQKVVIDAAEGSPEAAKQLAAMIETGVVKTGAGGAVEISAREVMRSELASRYGVTLMTNGALHGAHPIWFHEARLLDKYPDKAHEVGVVIGVVIRWADGHLHEWSDELLESEIARASIGVLVK